MAEQSVTATEKFVEQIPRFNLREEIAKANPPKPAAPAPETVQAKEPPSTPAVETPSDPLITEPDPVEAKEGETTGKDPEPRKPSRSYERRIDKIVRSRAEAQARAEKAELELQNLRSSQTPRVDEGAPRMEDFTDVKEYEKSVRAHERKIALEEHDKKQKDTQQQQVLSRLSSEWEDRLAKAYDKYDDFDEVVGEIKPVNPLSIAIMEEENGPDIAHYLGKNPKEIRRILDLSVNAQVREIGKLSIKLSQTSEPKKPSKAPPPITPVTGSGSATDTEYKPGMSPEAYAKWRAKNLPRS